MYELIPSRIPSATCSWKAGSRSLASSFSSDISLSRDSKRVNGKSIMGLMMLAAGPGSKLIVHANGPDALKALAEIENLIKRKFDEE